MLPLLQPLSGSTDRGIWLGARSGVRSAAKGPGNWEAGDPRRGRDQSDRPGGSHRLDGPQRSHGGPRAQGGSGWAPLGDSPSPYHHPWSWTNAQSLTAKTRPLSWNSLTQQGELGGLGGDGEGVGGARAGGRGLSRGHGLVSVFLGDPSVCPWGGGDTSEMGSCAYPSGSVSVSPSPGSLRVQLMHSGHLLESVCWSIWGVIP